MAIFEIIKKLISEKIVTITNSELEELISQSEVIEEKNIVMCGFLRILVYDNHVIIQEQTDKKELVVRLAESIDEAKEFLMNRLEAYERMWDGCGCKINYFS